MSALRVLRDYGDMPAVDIAHRLGVPLQAVYVELVQAESAGKARMVSIKPRGVPRVIEWRAVRQERAEA
jgi:hypothetical protein